ncbi:MAG: hypothetical protein V7603_238, partial [Micromonosporaceae bacterium]
LALVLPAFVSLIVAYGWPAVWTLRTSFQKVNILHPGAGGGFTTRNYSSVFGAGLAGHFGFALSLAVVPLVVALLAAPLLAWAAHRGGRVARWVTRGVLALPLAAYAPTALALARLNSLSPEQRGADPATTVRSLYWWGTVGLVVALATTLYLAAVRQRGRRGAWPALAVAAGIAFAAVIAAAVQDFTYSYVSVGGARGGATPIIDMYQDGFVRASFGTGAAAATVVLAVLCLLGLGATLVIVLSGLRLEFDDGVEPTVDPGTRVVGMVLAAAVLLIVAFLSIYGLAPLLGGIFGGGGSRPPLPASTATIEVNTWAPSLLTTLVAVTAAVAAAFGIGWLRPLGRHSPWLLLPFGPFLFVGMGPLVLHGFASRQGSGGLDTFLSLAPPAWIAIPALFVMALLFRGQAERADALRRQGRPPALARRFLLALPMLGLVFLATWVAHAQDLIWPLISVSSAQRLTAPVALVQARLQYAAGPGAAPYDLVLPAAVFVLLLLLTVAAQLFYLDRVALRVGRPD